MLKLVVAAALLFTGSVFAQGLEPGEWEFTSTSSSPLLAKPQTATVKHCVRKEDADDPRRWMGGGQNRETDCTVTPGAKTADSYSWQMSCPKSNMRGSGTARMGRGTIESEMRMTGDMQGQKFDITTKMSGRRLGPCKS